MSIIEFIVLYVLSLVIFMVVDFLWIGLVANKFYLDNLGKLLRKDKDGKLSPRWLPALIFYLIYVFGVVYFGSKAGLDYDSWSVALINGALFGGLCYATYDLTNYSTLRDFPLKVVILDMSWGMFVSALVAVSGFGLWNVLF